MREFWPNILLLLIVLLSLSLIVSFGITGFNLVNVSIKSKLAGNITSFVYEGYPNVSQTENILVEFTNIGSEEYDVKIEVYIYFYDNGLQEVGYYYDSSVPLYPGMRRSFEANYRPNEMGYYYIKVRVSMGSRRMERWGSFYASFPGYSPTIPAEYYPVIYQGTVERSLVLNYSDVVNVSPGKSVMTNMRVKNIGNATIHEVNLHLSSSNLLDIDLSPKEYYYLEPNQTITFLLDISTPGNIPITEYPIDFELVTRELKEIGTIIVNVTPYDISLEEDIADRILNYELLTAQVERDIIDARSRGINTTAAQESLDEAKQNIQEAKIYLDAKEYDNAEEALDKAKDNLKDAVLKLTQASFAVFVAPAFSPFWILIIIILIAIFLFLVLRRREREKKKPKLLKEAESGT